MNSPISKTYKYYYFFSIFFIPLVPAEISSHFIEIPAYENLNVDTGRVAYTKVVSRWGHQFMLINNKNKILMTCNHNYGDSLYCPPFDIDKEHKFYEGKNVIARWYRQEYMSGGVSNILLELNVDGKVVMDYPTQKKKYLSQVGEGSHFAILMTIFLITLGIYGQVKHTPKKSEKTDRILLSKSSEEKLEPHKKMSLGNV